MRTSLLVVLGSLAVAAAGPAFAADHVVRMLNNGPGGAMVFSPSVLRVAPGDRVTFVPTDRSHNAESIPGMLPAGAAPFRGAINQPITVTFSRPGVYGYKCLPHYGMGMVGVVIVGNPAANIAAARQVGHPGRARQVMTGLLNQAAAPRTASR